MGTAHLESVMTNGSPGGKGGDRGNEHRSRVHGVGLGEGEAVLQPNRSNRLFHN